MLFHKDQVLQMEQRLVNVIYRVEQAPSDQL